MTTFIRFMIMVGMSIVIFMSYDIPPRRSSTIPLATDS